VGLDRSSDDHQAEAGGAGSPRARRVCAEERFEQAIERRIVDSRTLVADGQHDPGSRPGAGQLDNATACVSDRVLEEVAKSPHEKAVVGAHRTCVVGQLEVQLHAAVGSLVVDPAPCLGRGGPNVHVSERQLARTHVEAAGHQQLVHHAVDRVDLGFEILDPVRWSPSRTEELERHLHARQW